MRRPWRPGLCLHERGYGAQAAVRRRQAPTPACLFAGGGFVRAAVAVEVGEGGAAALGCIRVKLVLPGTTVKGAGHR